MTRILAALLGFFFLLTLAATPTVRAEPRLTAAKSTACTATNATVRFDWQAMAGAQQQWVDLSVIDNGFAAGTFVGYGPLGANATTMSWANLEPGVAHFWRVNARTASGWSVSATGTFVPCGAAAPLAASKITCSDDGGTATVSFRWAPSSVTAQSQWLDLSLSDNGFAPSTFVSAGPFSPDAASFSWPGIQGGAQHFFRINTLTPSGWQSSKTGSLVACPKPTIEGIDAPPPIPGPEAGEHWVLVDTEKQLATAMVGDRPLYTALVTTGKEGWETPKGTYHIIYRVADETMTSSSIGAEEFYVLDHVLYTQYFTNEGHALHLNYWRDDSYFGNIASSHGCVGMRLASAEFFWRFVGVGSRVTVI